MDAAAEGREDADAPIAELVADTLDDDGAVVGNLLCDEFLVGEIAEDILGGLLVEVVVVGEPGDCGAAWHGTQLADESADATTELDGPACAIAVPEGHLAWLAGSWADEDAIVGDLVDAPGGSAEDEGLAGASLEDHLLVELADANGLVAAREEDAVEAAIGDGSTVEDGDALDALSRREPVAGAIPGDAGAEVGELVGGIAACEHVEDAVEDRCGEACEGSGAADEGEERGVGDSWRVVGVGCRTLAAASCFVGGQRRMCYCGDHLLSEDVERVAEEARGLDVAFVHGLRYGGAGDEIGAVLGEDDARRWSADLVACAADALHAAGDAGRSFDLDDEVDCAHVDAELE